VKVLCVIPPYVPSYFNAGHHLPVFQVAAYLRAVRGDEAVARDLGAGNATWRDVCGLLVQGFDAVLMLNDFDAVDGFDRFVRYARELAPGSRLATFGRGSRQVPHFFARYGLNAIVASGDYESGAVAWLDHLEHGTPPAGVLLREDGYAPRPPGRFLDAEDWVLPDIDEIPFEAYDRLYADDLAKFCGIPARRELVVPVARGCPVGCGFCDVPSQQGLKERRLSVGRTVAYIEAALARHPFEYVSFYAPTFTLKRKWVDALCDALGERLPSLRWKCVTTLAHLDEALIARMGKAGCVRISVGVETLDEAASEALPLLKRRPNASLDRIAGACQAAGVELNCFLMIGMPGEPVAHAARTIQRLIAGGHRVRPTVYTPYERLTADMDTAEYAGFNRQLLTHGDLDASERANAYQLLYANLEDRVTRVMERIPGRRIEA